MLCREMGRQELRQDLEESKKKLEDITGAPVWGFRAPGFSVDPDILHLVAEIGYAYDSSYNSFSLNKRYGRVEVNGNRYRGLACRISEQFYELPISNLEVAGKAFPWGGGGYFRLIPPSVFQKGVQHILNQKGAYLFYFHPWEIDPDQPRVNAASALNKFRQYINLGKAVDRLKNLFCTFSYCRFISCRQFLS